MCELQSAHLPGVHCQPLHNTATAQCPTQDALPASVRVYIQVVYTPKSAHTKSQADSFRFGGSRAQTTKKKEPALKFCLKGRRQLFQQHNHMPDTLNMCITVPQTTLQSFKLVSLNVVAGEPRYRLTKKKEPALNSDRPQPER